MVSRNSRSVSRPATPLSSKATPISSKWATNSSSRCGAGIELIHQPPGGSDERGQAVGAVDGLRLGIELRLLQVDAAFLQMVRT